jgi:hypothetical protein
MGPVVQGSDTAEQPAPPDSALCEVGEPVEIEGGSVPTSSGEPTGVGRAPGTACSRPSAAGWGTKRKRSGNGGLSSSS